jgi:hypothetical protein
MLVPMNAPKDHSYGTDILDTLSPRVMVDDVLWELSFKTPI